MTLAQQYDQQKEEVAHYYRESDAIDSIHADLHRLRASSRVDQELLEDSIYDVETWIHYNESLEYILSQIPDNFKQELVNHH